MKKSSLIWTAMLALLLAGCSSDSPVPGGNEPAPVPVKAKKTITATISGTSTKTALGTADANGDYTPVWQEGDEIGVFFNAAGSAVKFTLISGAGTSTGVFEGAEGGDSYQAFYPYKMISGAVSSGSIDITLPSSQVYTEGSFAPDAFPMLSSVASDNGSLTFTNLMSVARISLTGTDEITSLTLFPNNVKEEISGPATVNLSTKTLTTSSGYNSLSLSLPSGGVTLSDTPKDFYLVIPAQSYTDGLRLEVASGDDSAAKEVVDMIVFNGSEIRQINATITDIHGLRFPDENFRAYILNNFDCNQDGKLTQEEADLVTEIVLCSDEVESAEGIEYFTNLQRLDLYGTRDQKTGAPLGGLTSIDLSQNTALRNLNLSNNALGSVDLSQNTALNELRLSNCELTNLNLFYNTALTYLDCSENLLTSLPISKSTDLTVLNCSNNRLTVLALSKNTALRNLNISYNQISNLNLTNNVALTSLNCQHNELTDLNLSKNTELWVLNCSYNQLTALDLSLNTSLGTFYCYNNQLTELDLSKNTNLSSLYCQNNSIGEVWLPISVSLINLQKDDSTLIRYIELGQMQKVTSGTPIVMED